MVYAGAMRKPTRYSRRWRRAQGVKVARFHTPTVLREAGFEVVPREVESEWLEQTLLPRMHEYVFPVGAVYENDPVAVLHVIDLLLRIEDSTFASDALADVLLKTCPFYRWTAYNVGRIVGAIYQISAENGETVLSRKKDRWGSYYETTVNVETWGYLARLRAAAGSIAKEFGSEGRLDLWDRLSIDVPYREEAA